MKNVYKSRSHSLSFNCVAIAVFSTACIASSTAQANLITNGEFDTFVPSNGSGGGWTSSVIDSAGGWVNGGGNPGAYFILNDVGESGSDPTLSQTISGLTIGESYLLTGDYALHYAIGNVTLEGSLIASLDSVPILGTGLPANSSGFTGFSAFFVATTPSAVLSFAAEANGSDYSYGIDNISVTAAVPEPVTITLLAAMPLTAASRRWRRGVAR